MTAILRIGACQRITPWQAVDDPKRSLCSSRESAVAMSTISLQMRLVLCAVPVLAVYAPVLIDTVWPFRGDDLYRSIFLGAYGSLTGACVMVPFVEARSRRSVRMLLLVLLPALLLLSLNFLIGESDSGQPTSKTYIYASLFGAGVSTVCAAVLIILAPLSISRIFWPLVFCSGALSGAGVLYYFDVFFCLFGVSEG